jgi:hypothetical protein
MDGDFYLGTEDYSKYDVFACCRTKISLIIPLLAVSKKKKVHFEQTMLNGLAVS